MDVLRRRIATVKVGFLHVTAITFVHAACHDIGGKDRVVHLHAGKREDVGLAQVGDADLAVAAIHERQDNELGMVARQIAVADLARCKLERTDRLLAHGVQRSFPRTFRACFRDQVALLAQALCFRFGERVYVVLRQLRSDDRGFHGGIHLVNRHQFDELAQITVQVLLRGLGTARHTGMPFRVADPPGSQEHAGVEGCALEGVSTLHGLELDNREGGISLAVFAHTQMDGGLVTARDRVLADDTVCDVDRRRIALIVESPEEGGTFFLAAVFASSRFFGDLLAVDGSLGSTRAAFGSTTFVTTTVLVFGLSHDHLVKVEFQ